MQIKKELDGTTLKLSLLGELDAIAARELNGELANIDGVKELIFDLAGLEYVASAGLRSLFVLQKKNEQARFYEINKCSQRN